ncbi:hypothetical protein Tco_0026592 [Tanacetum coccineum]
MSNDQNTHGFLPAPPTTTITTNELNHQQEPPSITQESQLDAAVGRAILSIRNAVAAVNNSPILTPSLNNNQDQPSKTITVPRKTRRRRPFHRTTISDKKECPQIKRLRKMEEMVTEIEQKCSEFTRESGEVLTQELEHDGDHDENQNVNEAKVEQDGEEKEDEDIEDCVEFKRLDDGSLRIQLSCSCTKRFEILHNKIGCFYRLI